MTTKEIQTSVEGFEKQTEKQDIMSKIKGLINDKISQNKDSNDKTNDSKNSKRISSRAFLLTKKNMTIYVIIMLIAVGAAIFTGIVAFRHYSELNQNTDSLRQLSTYNVSPNKTTLGQYLNDEGKIDTIEEAISVYNDIEDILAEREEFKAQQQIYYQALLQNIYLPSLNIWKDPYTQKFDMTILGQKYLENDKFQDLSLIQYWSDFFRYVGNDADANTIESITIGEMEELEGTDYFYIPVSISFSSPNKRSFLLLVNKLSMTSNPTNIALLNEFVFYLFANIKDMKADELQDLEQEYREEFHNGPEYEKFNSIEDMDDEEYSNYQDKIIGYSIYKWINYEGTGSNEMPLIDDDVIVSTIKENAMCDENAIDTPICFYNFRDKYRDLPYLAYGVGLTTQDDRTQGLKDFLQDLSSVIAVTNFGFDRYSNASFLNNQQEQYEGTIEFNAYGRTISATELEEAAEVLGNMCFGNSEKMSPDAAYKRIQNNLAALGSTDDITNVTTLDELSVLFTTINSEYDGLTNYQKMIKLFELWRMLNDANLCNV